MKKSTYSIIDHNRRGHWWYETKGEIIISCLEKFAGIRRNGNLNILDIGTGPGNLIESLKNYGSITGIDNSREALKYCEEKGYCELILGDTEKLPFKEETFDLVVASDIIEHLEEDEEFLRQAYKTSKKKGYLLLTTAAFKFLWSGMDIIAGHKRRYKVKGLRKILEDGGWEVKKLSYYNFNLFFPIVFYRLIEKMSKIRPENELRKPNLIINFILRRIFNKEKFWLRYIDYPFGVSILAIAQKK